MARTGPTRTLFLAVPEEIFVDLFEEPIGSLLLENHRLWMIAFGPQTEVILKWIPERNGSAPCLRKRARQGDGFLVNYFPDDTQGDPSHLRSWAGGGDGSGRAAPALDRRTTA
jgi:hypothetical protein